VALKRVAGVHDANVSYESGLGTVTYDTGTTSPHEFIGHLERLTGFTAEVITTGSDDPRDTVQVNRNAADHP
jgi:copper chaperone CopZ